MIYPVVRELAGDGIRVTTACRVLKVSTSGYHEWDGCGEGVPSDIFSLRSCCSSPNTTQQTA